MNNTIHKHKKSGDSVVTTLSNDGGTTVIMLVSGTIKGEEDSIFDIIDVTSFSNKPKNLRMDSLVFSVETGLKLFLRYRNNPHIIPLEGRGKIELDKVGGVVGHEIDLVCRGVGSFFLAIDAVKMGV